MARLRPVHDDRLDRGPARPRGGDAGPIAARPRPPARRAPCPVHGGNAVALLRQIGRHPVHPNPPGSPRRRARGPIAARPSYTPRGSCRSPRRRRRRPIAAGSTPRPSVTPSSGASPRRRRRGPYCGRGPCATDCATNPKSPRRRRGSRIAALASRRPGAAGNQSPRQRRRGPIAACRLRAGLLDHRGPVSRRRRRGPIAAPQLSLRWDFAIPRSPRRRRRGPIAAFWSAGIRPVNWTGLHGGDAVALLRHEGRVGVRGIDGDVSPWRRRIGPIATCGPWTPRPRA